MGCTSSAVKDVRSPVHSTASAGITLYVIVPFCNPIGFKNRSQCFLETVQALMQTQQVLAKRRASPTLHITTVELSYGDDPIVPVDFGSFVHRLHLRTSKHNVMWHKENLVNLAVAQLPPKAHYVAWVDADILFDGHDWVNGTIKALDSMDGRGCVQLFERAAMLGPNRETMFTVSSFASQHAAHKSYVSLANNHADYWHPGFAWGSTVDTLKAIGGLPERTLGSADRHLAMSFIGRSAETVPSGIHANYVSAISEMAQVIAKDGYGLSVAKGVTIQHLWHGSLVDRKYLERWDILKKYNFDPLLHVERRPNGLLWWSEAAPAGLVADTYKYFQQRNEDSTSVAGSTPKGGFNSSKSNPGASGGVGVDADTNAYGGAMGGAFTVYDPSVPAGAGPCLPEGHHDDHHNDHDHSGPCDGDQHLAHHDGHHHPGHTGDCGTGTDGTHTHDTHDGYSGGGATEMAALSGYA